jgi:Inovirus Coat protein B
MKLNRVLVGVAAAAAAGVAFAAAGDPDLTAITTAATTVGAVGAAVFAVAVGIKLFKWIRSAL